MCICLKRGILSSNNLDDLFMYFLPRPKALEYFKYQFNMEMMSFFVHICIADTKKMCEIKSLLSVSLHIAADAKQIELAFRTLLKEMQNLIRPNFTHHILMSTAANSQGLLWPCSPVNSFTATLCMSLFYWGHEQFVQSYMGNLYCVWFIAHKWVASALCICCLSYSISHFPIKKERKVSIKNEWNLFLIRVPDFFLRFVMKGFGEKIRWFGDPATGCHDMNWWSLCFWF